MTWTGSEKPESNGFVGKLTPDQVLYFYDGPILFTMRMGVFNLLIYKVDESDDDNLFLVKQVSPPELERLQNGRLSLKGALQATSYWLVQTGSDLTVANTWLVEPDDLPEAYWPKAGFGLEPGQRNLPDTLLQSESFFSVRFTGASLGRGRISFRLFKELTDRFYYASTQLLKPEAIQGLKGRQAFDMTMSPPQFASLLVALNKPDIDVAFVNARNESRGLLTTFDYHAEVLQRREGFFSVFGEVATKAARGSLSSNAITHHYAMLETLQDLLPTGEDAVRTTEFYANGKLSGQQVFLDIKAGVVLREAIQTAKYVPREVTGRVTIINKASGTFVIEDLLSLRAITCSYRRDWFDFNVGVVELRVGRIISVYGSVTPRTNRDWISVERDPTFQSVDGLKVDQLF